MKRILLLFMVFVNIFLFMIVHVTYKEQETSDIYNLYHAYKNDHHKTVTFNNEFIDIDKNEFMEYLLDLVNKYDVTVMKNEFEYDAKTYKYYLFSNQNILEKLGLISDVSIDFSIFNDKYYTNNIKDLKGEHLYTLNRDSSFNIYPLNHLLNDEADYLGEYTFFTSDLDVLNGIISEITMNYSSYIEGFQEYSQDSLDLNKMLKEQLYYLIIFSMGFAVIIFLILISTSLKKMLY